MGQVLLTLFLIGIPPGLHEKCHNLDRFLSSDLKRIAKFKLCDEEGLPSIMGPVTYHPVDHGLTPAAHPPLQKSLKWSQLSYFSTDVRTQFLSTSHPLYSCRLPILTPAVFPLYSRRLPATPKTTKMIITSRKCGYENIHNSYPASCSPILLLLLTYFTPAVYPPLQKPLKRS